MPGVARPGDLSEIVAEMQDELRRLRRAAGASQNDIWKYDTFTITGAGDTTHTLSFIPKGINVALLNKSGLTEGTDYTCDYTTGIITVLTAVAAGNVLHVRYVTTAELMVYSTVPDAGTFGDPTAWAINSNQAQLNANPATGTTYYSILYAGSPRNTADITPTSLASSAHKPLAICAMTADGTAFLSVTVNTWNPSSAYPKIIAGGYNISIPGHGQSGSAFAISVSSQPTVGCSYDGTTLYVRVNGSVANSFTLDAAQQAGIAGAAYAGLAGTAANDGQPVVTIDALSINGGAISDSFNRANAVGLGVADTGQEWSYVP